MLNTLTLYLSILVPKFRGREIKFLISRSQEVANLNYCEQELLEDPAVTSAIDEETEFNALVVCGFILSK